MQYELSANPFSNAISAFEKYINEYPKAARRSEAEQHLSDIYMTTRNYSAAIASLEKITHRSARLNEAYQRVLCYKGMECYNAGKYADARRYFKQSMDNNYLSEVYSQCLYWTGESYYQEGDFAAAGEAYNRFFASEGASRTPEFLPAYYSAGYAHFKQRQYAHALTKFQTYESRKGFGDNQQLASDVYNRIGDCCFMLSDLNKAQQYYGKTVSIGVYDVDYALYQRAESMGGLYKYDEKIALMGQLRERYPASGYASDALMEMADTYLSKGSSDKAAELYSDYVQRYPQNQRTKEVLLKLGLL